MVIKGVRSTLSIAFSVRMGVEACLSGLPPSKNFCPSPCLNPSQPQGIFLFILAEVVCPRLWTLSHVATNLVWLCVISCSWLLLLMLSCLRTRAVTNLFFPVHLMRLLWCFSGKESACQCRRCRFNPWVGKMPWRRKWQSTPVFLLGNSMHRGAWGATVHGVHGVDLATKLQ